MSREGKKRGERGKLKKGGRACKDKDSSDVLPSTHLHNDPELAGSLSRTDTHADACKMLTPQSCQSTNAFQCTCTAVSRSQRNTPHHILLSIHSYSLSSHSSRTRQGCLLLPVHELKGGVSRRRRGWGKNGWSRGEEEETREEEEAPDDRLY